MFVIALFAVYLIFVSAHTEKVIDAEIGYFAPYFTFGQDENQISSEDVKGKYLLLSFWSSSDAQSRIVCKDYTEFMRSLESSENICHVGVNFDRTEKLFEELVRLDNLSVETQYYAQGDNASQIIENYHLENGFQSYLVDKQGRIVAKNPSTTFLLKILEN